MIGLVCFISHICLPALLYFTACSAETEKVCNVSSEEHLQPFKDKMEEFLTGGKKYIANIGPIQTAIVLHEIVPFESEMSRFFILASHGFKQETKVMLALRNIVVNSCSDSRDCIYFFKTVLVFRECIPKAVHDTVFSISKQFGSFTVIWLAICIY